MIVKKKINIVVCPPGKARVNGICIYKFRPPTHLPKPVKYLYPEKPMDISVQLNLKNSEFTTIYPKFNGKNT